MTTLTLYMYPAGEGLSSISSVCAAVHLALKRSQLEHDVELVRKTPRGISPTGRLPAVRFDDEVVAGSSAILDRLETLDPPRRFWPDDPRERARDRAWEHVVTDALYWPGFYERWCVPQNRSRLLDVILGRGLVRHLAGPVLAWQFAGRARGQGIALKSRDEVRAELLRGLDLVEAGIAAGPFMEERGEPGRADLALGGYLPQLAHRGLCPWAGEQLLARPTLVTYLARVHEACGVSLPTLR